MSDDPVRTYVTTAERTWEGEAIGEPEVLERLAVDAGLPEAEVRDVLASDRYAEAVREDERTAHALGIHAVPFFVVDRRIGASGAQSPEILGRLLREGRPETAGVPLVATGEACGPEGC